MKPTLDTDRIDDVVLALLYLNLCKTGNVWKGFDWDTMNRLHERGFISDPVGRAKSVVFSEEGETRAKQLFEHMFRARQGSSANRATRGNPGI